MKGDKTEGERDRRRKKVDGDVTDGKERQRKMRQMVKKDGEERWRRKMEKKDGEERWKRNIEENETDGEEI